jgi:hypothetical protein
VDDYSTGNRTATDDSGNYDIISDRLHDQDKPIPRPYCSKSCTVVSMIGLCIGVVLYNIIGHQWKSAVGTRFVAYSDLLQAEPIDRRTLTIFAYL